MYLSDNDIRARLPQLNVAADDPTVAFDPADQVQPCSIDLRLSNVFWLPQKGRAIDLRKSKLLELEPTRYWKQVVLRRNECLTLRPHELVVGRTYEKFSVPSDCAGKIEGRSSFARMGLSIHCTGDFLNPGYRGHMPLELVNNGPNPLKIFPHIPICQLMLIKLSSEPARKYGHQELQSKYMDDDGAPKYWWRDKRMSELQKRFSESSVEIHVQEHLFRVIGVQDPEIIERFERMISHMPEVAKENAETLLDRFVKSEDGLRRRHTVGHAFARALCIPLFFFALKLTWDAIVGSATNQPFCVASLVILWAATALTACLSVWSLRQPTLTYLGRKELQAKAP
jgi:deoxycytidine triphosphate deaminase